MKSIVPALFLLTAVLTAVLAPVLAAAPAWAQGALPWPTYGSTLISGNITGYLSTPSGALDGFTLDSGATVHFPPQSGSALEPILKAGQGVTVTGTIQSGPNGQMFEAQKITNSSTGQTVSIETVPPRSTLPLPGAVPPPGLTLSS